MSGRRSWRPIVQICSIFALALLSLAFIDASARGADLQAPPEGPQGGPGFTVNDPADPGDPMCSVTSCSLRAAILAANAGSITSTQTIDFDLAFPVTITLSSPLPPITGTVAIQGPGAADLVVSGAGMYSIFEVGTGAELTLAGLALRQGFAGIHGGAIYVDHGSLTLVDTVLADNLAGGGNGGGLYNDAGHVAIAGSTFQDNHAFHDGAIANNGTMDITDSLFRANHARVGGAIENNGVLTITHSTFTENVAPIASGGAVQNQGMLVIANSTFFDNGSPMGADIYNSNGTVYLTHSTFYSATLPSMDSIASSGISATVTISNSVLAAGAAVNSCAAVSGGVIAASPDNLATDATCAGATVVTLDQLKLGSLQNNGGAAPTVALLPSSVAVDAGDDGVCAAPVGAPLYGAGGRDQRGVARPQGLHCDVGAFEQLPHRLYLPDIH